MCYKGWLQQCTQRSIGESSTSSISSRSGYNLIFILISLIFYYNVLLFSLLNFPILLQTFTAKRFWIHQFLWLSDSPEFSWVILSLSLSLFFFFNLRLSLSLSQRASLSFILRWRCDCLRAKSQTPLWYSFNPHFA